jgi:hypothetical protein
VARPRPERAAAAADPPTEPEAAAAATAQRQSAQERKLARGQERSNAGQILVKCCSKAGRLLVKLAGRALGGRAGQSRPAAEPVPKRDGWRWGHLQGAAGRRADKSGHDSGQNSGLK